jgi:hypothetical protein
MFPLLVFLLLNARKIKEGVAGELVSNSVFLLSCFDPLTVAGGGAIEGAVAASTSYLQSPSWQQACP